MKANRFFLILITILTISGFFQNSYTQWTQSGGPFGGSIMSLTYNNKDIYVGSYNFGVSKSTNMGLNWSLTSLNDKNVNCMGSIGDTIIASTWYNALKALKISTDAGNTWMDRGWSSEFITIADNKIFVSFNNVFVYSTNLGLNWTTISTFNATVKNAAVIGDTIIAATNHLIKSTNFGQSWDSIHPYSSTCLKIKNNTIYFASGSYLYRSFDFGLTWLTTHVSGTQGVISMCFAGNNLFASSPDGIYLSTNNGSSFSLISNAYWVNAFELAGSNIIFAGSHFRGLYKTTDNGLNWFITPYHYSEIKGLTAINNYVYARTGVYGDTNFYYSSNSGETWNLSTLYNHQIYNLWCSGNNLLVTAFSLLNSQWNIYLSSNYGMNWQPTLNGITDLPAVEGNNIFIPKNGTTYYSSNNGFNWSNYSNNLNVPGITSVAAKGNNLYIGAANSYNQWKGVYRSTDSGHTFVQTAINNKYIYSIVTLNSNVYAASNSGVYMSTNYGVNWTQSAVNFGEVICLLVYGNNILVSTKGSGILLMNSEGTNFVPKSQGFILNYPLIYHMKSAGNYFYAGTNGLGVWRRSIADLMDINNVGSEIPDEYALEQNYPNPFNSSTKIGYKLPSAGNVLLNVYDILGREVAVLVNSRQNSGNHSVNFEAGKFSSGIYIYRLNVNCKIIGIKRAVHIK